jgi:6-phosphogluconolactonase
MAELKLQVVSGNAAGTFIQLDRELVFGRAAEPPADLAGDPAVSRNHARIRRSSEGRFLIEDLGSANGTYVNGTRIDAPQLLSPGDKIKLGDSVLEVVTTSGERTQVSPIAPGAGATRIAARPPVEPVPPVPPVPPSPPREPVAAGGPAQAGGPLLPPGVQSAPLAPPKSKRGVLVPVLAVVAVLGVAGTIVGFATRTSKTKTVAATAAQPPGGATAAAFVNPSTPPVGFVYTETNASPNNQVLIFDRYANGTLKQAGAVSTGGSGGHQQQGPCNPPGGCPFLDTQNEVVLAPGGSLLFVVNAGSNDITSFRVTKTGLSEVSVIGSGGVVPNSLTVSGNVLYVLNSNSDNIAGFHFSQAGMLTAIPGSAQPLVGGALPGLPRQIGFNPSGNLLMVTLLANKAGPPPAGGTADTIDTFPVANGVAGAGTAHNSTTHFPFAFAFDSSGHAVVAQVNSFAPGPGTAQSYGVANSGTTTPISGLSTNGFGACWVVVTGDQRYAYVVNTGNGAIHTPTPGASIAEYKLSSSGTLTLIGNTVPLSQFLETDPALTPDGKYLYVVAPLEARRSTQTAGGTDSLIDLYAVHPDGSLSFVASTPDIPSPGLTGLAVN